MQKIVKLWLRRKKDGSGIYYLVEDVGGRLRRISLGHGDRKKAERQRLERQYRLSDGDVGGLRARSMPLWELCIAYLAANARIESSTADICEKAFDHLHRAIGDCMLAKFDYGCAERFQGSMRTAGLSEVSANIYVKAVRPVFRWAVDRKLINEDPFAKLQLFKIAEGEIRIYETAEFELMLAVSDRLWQARLLLAKTAGLRRGEMLNLTIDDCDFGRGIIKVQPKRETAYTWRWVPKGKARRQLPMTEDVAARLIELAKGLAVDQPYMLITADRYRRIMELKAGGRLKDRIRRCPDENFTKPFERIRRRAGVSAGTYHDMRRTCITEWLERGLQPHEVKQLAGHVDIDTTMRYYVTTRQSLLDRARLASASVFDTGCAHMDVTCAQNRSNHTHRQLSELIDRLGQLVVSERVSKIGARGLEPPTS